MAYELAGNVKKGVKVKYSDGSESGSSRTYNGLNVNTNETLAAGAVNGLFIGTAAGIFDSLFTAFTDATVTTIYYNTEEEIENA